MKRDMDLVRSILFRMEEHDYEDDGSISADSFEPEYTERQVMHHFGLLWKAGLIDAMDASAARGEYYIPTAITWQGHEFLDAVRSQSIWNQVKTKAKDFGGFVPLEIAKLLAIQYAKDKLGISNQ